MNSLIILALLWAGQDLPPRPGPGSMITQRPQWVARPDAKDIQRVYPKVAGRLAIGGRAVLQCRVRLTGAADSCVVVSESPRGFGFGAAAVQMSPSFLFSPELRDGVAVDDGRIRIPISFSMPADWPPQQLTYRQALNCITWHSARLVVQPNDALSVGGLPKVEAAARFTGEKGLKSVRDVEADIADARIKDEADLPRLAGRFLSAEMCARGT